MNPEPLPSTSAESPDWLDELADDLALNYLDMSISLSDLATKRQSKIEQVFKPEVAARISGEPSRNILVLGAGASWAAFGADAFPGADEAMKRLDERLAAKLGERPEWIQNRIDNEKQRLVVAYDYKDAERDFETHLAILSTIYSPQEIATTLAEMYRERYWPHLTFEIIAHILKHRFVDVVINFNFDELLDQAIEEELGLSQYHYVISDGNCNTIQDVMIAGKRLKVPIHIKPHGTASHTSTLRFTKEHYFTLPDDMRRFMQNIVGGCTSDNPDGERYPVNIISVGFGMRSLDFVQMIRTAATANHVTIYHLNTSSWAENNRERLIQSTGVDDQRFIDVKGPGLHNVLRSLISRIGDRFHKAYIPRGIARHELVHAIFCDEDGHKRIPSGGGEAKNEVDYLRARLCTELAISLAKGNGRVDLAALVDDRVGIYFDRLREQASGLSGMVETSISKLLEMFSDTPYRLVRGGVDRNILSASYPLEWGTPERPDQQPGAWLWALVWVGLAKIHNPELKARVDYFRENTADSVRMAGFFQKLVEADTRDINADFTHRHLLLASEPDPDEVLHTNLSFALKFADLMLGEWDVMLAVSEYGRVLDKCLDLLGPAQVADRRFCVVLAQRDHEADTKKRLERFAAHLKSSEALEQKELPFWLHNHHMIIVLKRNAKEPRWDYKGGIRYERQGLGNRINPVYLHETDIEDLRGLVKSFFGYVWEATHPDWSNRPKTDYDLNREIATMQTEMLDGWWNKLGTAH